jgi:pimeloyl-ACP methyl ester carboxylesterase
MADPDRPHRIARGAGLVGAVVGIAATGVAVGVAAERLLLRRRRPPVGIDPYLDEPFGPLPYDECLTITSDDGLDIYVEIVERSDGIDLDFGLADDSDPTLVFVHGFCLDMGTFHFQRTALARRGDLRMVFYDQPGHGRSGKLHQGEYTLESLGSALKKVIDETVPDGPIVLIGHSMGGMTIMSLAELYPDKMDEVNLGMPDFLARFTKPLMPVIIGGGKLTSGVVDNIRRASTDLAWLLTRRYGFGSARPSAALVSYVEQMNSTTSTEVIARYLRTLYSHARLLALAPLRAVPVLVVCGDTDVLTPLAHSEEICQVLPDAQLVVVEGGGHVVMLEHADEVNAALAGFLARVAPR